MSKPWINDILSPSSYSYLSGTSNVSTTDNHEKDEVGDWLEELLKNYWAVKEKKQISKSLNVTTDEVNRFPLKLKTATIDNQKANTKDSESNTAPSSTPSLSENVNIEICYSLMHEKSDRIQNLLSKICTFPIAHPDGQIDYRVLARKREVEFHTEVIPDLEAWALSRGVEINFGVPHCFYGNFEYARNGESCIGEQLSILQAMENSSTPLPCNNIEIYIMMLMENLEKHGYSRKPLGSHLSVEMVKNALKQMALIHAVSWAWQTSTKIPIKKRWPIFLNTKQSAKVYGDLIKTGLPLMQNILKRYLETTDNLEKMYLVDRLKIIEPKIHTYVHSNLIPSTFPAPNSIIHLDLQYRNIYFKKMVSENEGDEILDELNNNVASKSLGINNKILTPTSECRIANWGLASIGPPLHDVAFLIFTSLAPDVRRQETNAILKSYYRSFKEICEQLGVELTFSFPVILNQFPKSLLLAVLLVIGNLREADNDATVDLKSMNIFTEALKDLVSMQMI